MSSDLIANYNITNPEAYRAYSAAVARQFLLTKARYW